MRDFPVEFGKTTVGILMEKWELLKIEKEELKWSNDLPPPMGYSGPETELIDRHAPYRVYKKKGTRDSKHPL